MKTEEIEKIDEEIETVEQVEENKNTKKITEDKKTTIKNKLPIWKKMLITLLVLIILGMATVLTLFYGPISTFRDWWITTAMTTMSHQYLAEWFFNQETINEVLAKNQIED